MALKFQERRQIYIKKEYVAELSNSRTGSFEQVTYLSLG
jgi:hypothetical protein